MIQVGCHFKKMVLPVESVVDEARRFRFSLRRPGGELFRSGWFRFQGLLAAVFGWLAGRVRGCEKMTIAVPIVRMWRNWQTR